MTLYDTFKANRNFKHLSYLPFELLLALCSACEEEAKQGSVVTG